MFMKENPSRLKSKGQLREGRLGESGSEHTREGNSRCRKVCLRIKHSRDLKCNMTGVQSLGKGTHKWNS